MEKIRLKYSGRHAYGIRELTDIVRGSIVFQNEVDMCAFLARLERHDVPASGFSYSVVKSKNRFAKPADGYSDMMINIRLTHGSDTKGHIVELQVHHQLMEQAKKLFHCVYKFLRVVNEDRQLHGRTFEIMAKPVFVSRYLEPLRQAANKYPERMENLISLPNFDNRFGVGEVNCTKFQLNCKYEYKLEETFNTLMTAMREAYRSVQWLQTGCIKNLTLTNVPAVPVDQVPNRSYAQVSCT